MCDAAQQCVAVGFFDGVHVGHQAILRGATTVLTFRNHPLGILAPERAPRLIMSLEDRLQAIRACGVQEIVALDFTEELAREAPEHFLARLGRRVRCGQNWRFGAGGAGDAAFLRARGLTVEEVPYVAYRGEIISSTRIRQALESGEMDDARAMMGRPFMADGRVFQGKGEGVRLGFPTLNLALDAQVRLPYGVYAISCSGARAIANYGVAPTMGSRAWENPCLEVHFLDATFPTLRLSDCVRVAFQTYIRPERRFESERALAFQIAADICQVEALTW